ncbi:MAG TPA: hypothetical protein VFU69_17420 [Ktedonobacterales bacterium]|nr:hypothetical protein [Ktedonobacterales bacterium]
MADYSRINEVAPPRSGGVAEQRRPRRDHLTERLMHEARYNLHEMADRTAPLPADIPIERLLNFFMSLRMVEHLDRWEPSWDEQLRGRY